MENFANNSMVTFGDVNLATDSIGGPYQAGAGGWPTIRYFNKGTGENGAPYKKKTDGAMCDELGNDEHMAAYVEEAGSTSACLVADGSGCSEKENECASTEPRAKPPALHTPRPKGRYEGNKASLSYFPLRTPMQTCDTQPASPFTDPHSYIAKMRSEPSKQADALKRLQGMAGGVMKPELKKWLGQRISVLAQLQKEAEAPKEEL